MKAATVLMPVYNTERFLAAAIESILRQTFGDFEFLIVDDGSTDRSGEIARSYFDPRIRYLRNDRNLGIAATLNRGIGLARAELIARMDADDISYPERLMKQFRFMEANPHVALVSTYARNIAEDGSPLSIDSSPSAHFYYTLTFHCAMSHPTVMYRKAAVRRAGMYPDGYAEDYRFWCRLVRDFKFENIPEVLLDYRVFGLSTSLTLKQVYLDEEKKQARENLRFFLGDGYSIPDDWYEAYRNNFTPIQEKKNIKNMAACIRELDVIAKGVAARENVNRNERGILDAAAVKKARVLRYCLRGLGGRDRIRLLLALGSPVLVIRYVGKWVQRKVEFTFRALIASLAQRSGARATRRSL